MRVARRNLLIRVSAFVAVLVTAGCSLGANDGDTVYPLERVKQVFAAQNLPLTDQGGPIGDTGEVDRSKYTILAAPDIPGQPVLQVIVTVFRDVGDARRYESVAEDELVRGVGVAVGRDEMVMREGNVVVQYDAAAQPDRLPRVRKALDKLAE